MELGWIVASMGNVGPKGSRDVSVSLVPGVMAANTSGGAMLVWTTSGALGTGFDTGWTQSILLVGVRMTENAV